MNEAKTITEYFSRYSDNSYIKQLLPDPETEQYNPNKQSRPVKSGHYVLVKSTPISNSHLIAYSKNLANELRISDNVMKSDDMLKVLSGFPLNRPTWCTPYALSIYGVERTDNDPFKNDTGYGDGRCTSIIECVVNGKRWELQLKGAGTTPFSRSADGRAVLRSSIREYIASEAMNNMNVSTTRALSLIVSKTEKVNRAWYKNDDVANDVANNENNNETIYPNKVAIVCRVAPSFIRVGTLELFGRRARSGDLQRVLELKMMFRHMLFREYPELYKLQMDDAIIAVLREFRIRLSVMVADWLRVGYVQGNFNSDNCLVSGRTLDYGPFGFIELYKDKNFWSESGDHFSFFNQPKAAKMNFYSFANALKPLSKRHEEIDQIVQEFDSVCSKIVNKMWSKKLGLNSLIWNNGVDRLFDKLQKIMQNNDADYTIFWRQLALYPSMLLNNGNTAGHINPEPIMRAFYSKQHIPGLIEWLNEYKSLLILENRGGSSISTQMKLYSPKYIPREWMLATAYTYAEDDDDIDKYEYLQLIEQLLSKPYDEQPEMEAQFYRLTPLHTLTSKAGIAYMTCSS